MVEAAVSLPIIILAVMLLLRLFTFYLQIMSTGIAAHEAALREWSSYSGAAMKVYEHEEKVDMLAGGLLGFDVSKRIAVKAYFFNEDAMVRSG